MIKKFLARQKVRKAEAQKIAADAYLTKLQNSADSLSSVGYKVYGSTIGETLEIYEVETLIHQELQRKLKEQDHD